MMATEQVSVSYDCSLYRKYEVHTIVTMHASYDCAMAQMFSCWPINIESWVHAWVIELV
jgi:hypothetical protein